MQQEGAKGCARGLQKQGNAHKGLGMYPDDRLHCSPAVPRVLDPSGLPCALGNHRRQANRDSSLTGSGGWERVM